MPRNYKFHVGKISLTSADAKKLVKSDRHNKFNSEFRNIFKSTFKMNVLFDYKHFGLRKISIVVKCAACYRSYKVGGPSSALISGQQCIFQVFSEHSDGKCSCGNFFKY
jgi:hypothetical protein